MKSRTALFVVILCVPIRGWAVDVAVPQTGFELPGGTRLINGTGQLPLVGHKFAAPGFTSQGYIQICANAGPSIYLIGINISSSSLTLRTALKTSSDAAPLRVTYAERNKQLKLKNRPEETVVGPMQFYITDPIPLRVKAGQTLILRTFVPLAHETELGCGIISVSDPRPDNRWAYGNVVGGDDRTMDPDLELGWKPNSDFLFAPFLVSAERALNHTLFVTVIFGDSLTFQLEKDKGGTWFQNAFAGTCHIIANLAIGGDALGYVVSPSGELKSPLQIARFTVARHATDVINFYGHNDIGNGTSAATMLQFDKAFCARVPRSPTPGNGSGTLAPSPTTRPGVNLSTSGRGQIKRLTRPRQKSGRTRRALCSTYKQLSYDGLLEIGAALATGPDSPYWKPSMAGDGTHFGRNPANDLIAPVVRKILTDAPKAP